MVLATRGSYGSGFSASGRLASLFKTVSLSSSKLVQCASALMVLSTASSLAFAQELPSAPQPQYVASVDAEGARGSALPEGTVSVSTLMAEAGRNPRPATHRFFDRMSLLSTGMETAGLLADGVTTMNKLGQVRTENRLVNGVMTPVQMQITEVDPVGKIFVKGGWPGMIAGGAATVGADLGLRYWLHRTNHHKLERVVPFVITASNAFAAISNLRK